MYVFVSLLNCKVKYMVFKIVYWKLDAVKHKTHSESLLDSTGWFLVDILYTMFLITGLHYSRSQ